MQNMRVGQKICELRNRAIFDVEIAWLMPAQLFCWLIPSIEWIVQLLWIKL